MHCIISYVCSHCFNGDERLWPWIAHRIMMSFRRYKVYEANIENLVCISNKFMLWLKAMLTTRFFFTLYRTNSCTKLKLPHMIQQQPKKKSCNNHNNTSLYTVCMMTKFYFKSAVQRDFANSFGYRARAPTIHAEISEVLIFSSFTRDFELNFDSILIFSLKYPSFASSVLWIFSVKARCYIKMNLFNHFGFGRWFKMKINFVQAKNYQTIFWRSTEDE